jgi:hypothetical protein
MHPQQPAGAAAYIHALVPSATLFGADEIEHPLTNVLRILAARHERGTELLGRRQFKAILELWHPVAASEYFDPTHPEWSDKLFYRATVRIAVMQVFYAHARLLIEDDYEIHTVAAFRILSVLSQDASLLENVQHDVTLSEAGALAQDQNLHDLLIFAAHWFEQFGTSFFAAFGVDESSALDARRLIISREQSLAEIIARLGRPA